MAREVFGFFFKEKKKNRFLAILCMLHVYKYIDDLGWHIIKDKKKINTKMNQWCVYTEHIYCVPVMSLPIKLSRDYSECQGLTIKVIIAPPGENFVHARLSLG